MNVLGKRISDKKTEKRFSHNDENVKTFFKGRSGKNAPFCLKTHLILRLF